MNKPIVNSAFSPQVMVAFACAAWDAMAPAEREGVLLESRCTLSAAGAMAVSAYKFRELTRVQQYRAATRILLGPLSEFQEVR